MTKKAGDAGKAEGQQTQTDAGAQDDGKSQAGTQAQADNGGTDVGKTGDDGQQEDDKAAAATDDGKSGADGKPAPKSPHVPDWRDGRMAKQAQKLKDLEAEKQGLAEQLAALQRQRPQAERETDEVFQRRVNAEAERRAAVIARNQTWERDCNAVAEAGKKEYGEAEFDASVAGLTRLVDPSDKDSANAYASLITAAIHTGEAPKLVYMLGQDPNEANRIMQLSPVEQGVALARLAAKDVAKPSKAPKPLSPVGGGRSNSRTEIDARDSGSDELTTAEWMARRNAQIKDGKAGRGVRM